MIVRDDLQASMINLTAKRKHSSVLLLFSCMPCEFMTPIPFLRSHFFLCYYYRQSTILSLFLPFLVGERERERGESTHRHSCTGTAKQTTHRAYYILHGRAPPRLLCERQLASAVLVHQLCTSLVCLRPRLCLGVVAEGTTAAASPRVGCRDPPTRFTSGDGRGRP